MLRTDRTAGLAMRRLAKKNPAPEIDRSGWNRISWKARPTVRRRGRSMSQAALQQASTGSVIGEGETQDAGREGLETHRIRRRTGARNILQPHRYLKGDWRRGD